MEKSPYRKLTGRRRSIGGFSQLWLAADHILMVQSTRFVEQYRRFALADIQAIVVTPLRSRVALPAAALAASILWIAWPFVIAPAVFVPASLSLFVSGSVFAKVFFALTGAVPLIASILDIARGQRCRCHLYTAVTCELLAPVSRVRRADAFLERVRPAIESIQGSLTPEQAATLPPAAEPVTKPPEVPNSPGYLPEVLFGLFLANAALVLVAQRWPQQGAEILPTTFFSEFVILVFALIRRPGRDPRRFIYFVMAVALLFMFYDAFALARSFIGYMSSVMEQSRRGKTATPTIGNWIAFSRGPAIMAASWRAVTASVGLIGAFVSRARIK